MKYGRPFTSAAVEEDGEAEPRPRAVLKARRQARPRQAGAHGLVAEAILPEQPAIALDALPERLDPLGLALREVLGRLRDGAREPDGVDLPETDPPLLVQLAHELAAVEILDGADQRVPVQPADVDDLRLHRHLNRRGERVHGPDRILPVHRRVGREGHRLAEGHQHPAAKGLARLEGQPDGDEASGGAPGAVAGPPVGPRTRARCGPRPS